MSTETNKALVRRYYEEVLTKRDPKLVDELFAPDYVFHYAHTPPGLPSGLAGFKQFVTEFLSGYSQLHFVVDKQTVEGDKVVSHITAHSGSPIGAVMSIPADPEKVAESEDIKGTSTDRIVNGKIAESWLDFTVPNPLPQLEELPSEGENT
ncbi:MAG: ester cyclase [Chloroflexota bacterium]|nr:ester cyclase [Chloroflexota bacterium]